MTLLLALIAYFGMASSLMPPAAQAPHHVGWMEHRPAVNSIKPLDQTYCNTTHDPILCGGPKGT